MTNQDTQYAQTMQIDMLGGDTGDRKTRRPKTTPRLKKGTPARSMAEDGCFQALFDCIYDGALITDAEGTILNANIRALDMLSQTKGDLCRMTILDVISSSDESLLGTLRHNIDAHRYTLIQAFCIRKDETLFPAEIAVNRFQVPTIDGLCFLIRDISRRRQMEDSLREERNLLLTLINQLPALIYVKDVQSRFIIGNMTISTLMGVSTPDDLVGKTDFDFYPRELAEQYYADEQAVIATGEPLINKEEPCVDRQGNPKLLLTTKVPIKDRQNKIVGIVGIGRDITEQRLTESQRVHAQKLESIGQLAAGIAHEINTPIQYIGDNIRFLRDVFNEIIALIKKYDLIMTCPEIRTIPSDLLHKIEEGRAIADVDYVEKEIPTAIEQSLEGINRVAKIVQSMKEFSHPDMDEKTPANLNKAIESTVTVSRNEWKYVADLVLDLDPSLPAVPCLLGNFNQVILNLIVNAAHAIADVVGDGVKGKGVIRISTRQDENWVEVRVSDTGTGIPQAIRHRIFEPFFTTKAVGKGTGQGLTTCHSIVVKKHGGTISFETEEGKGTTFVVRLPVIPTSRQP